MNIRRIILSALIIIFGWIEADAQSTIYDAVLRSQSLRASGNFAEAIRLVTDVAGKNNDYRLETEMGEAYLQQGDYNAAKQSFMDASGLKSSAGSFGLARVFAALGNKSEAIRYLGENLASEFRMEEKAYHLDPFLGKIENSSEWRNFWNQNHFTDDEELLAEVKYQVAIENIKEAFDILDHNRDKLGEHPGFIYSEALVKYRDGQYKEVVGMLKTLPHGEVSDYMRIKLMGDALLAMEDYKGALASYSTLVDSEYPDPDLFINRAKAYLGLAEYRKSLADIDYYISLYPDDIQAMTLAGSVSAASGDINKGLAYLNQALELNPNLRAAYKIRGDIWSGASLWEKAVSDYSMALDLEPEDGEVYFNKAAALIKLERTDQACYDFRMALRYGNRKASEMINRYCIR